MTGREALRRAAAALDAAESSATTEERQSLCEIAEGWRRLAEMLAEHPGLETAMAAKATVEFRSQGEISIDEAACCRLATRRGPSAF